MPSIKGFLKALWLKSRLEQPPLVVNSPVPGTDISIKFAVHTWFEFHNRAQGSYTGEPDMVNWLKSQLQPDDVFWDIGANVGAYSLLASRLCPQARIYSFEPFIPTFSHLWENILLNGASDRVFPLNMGLLNKTAPEKLAVNDIRAGSSQHQVGGSGGVANQFVISMRGDEIPQRLGVAIPNLLKLDIDGLEVEAVEGLDGVLKNPSLRQAMIEVESGKTEKKVERLFQDSGFERIANPLTKATNGVFNALFSRA
jgi:FkbM family methyltransferase